MRQFPEPRPIQRAVIYSLIFGAVSATLSAADGDGIAPSIAIGFVIAAIALAVYALSWWARNAR